MFRSGPTFSNYVDYLEKSRCVLDQGGAWGAPSLRNLPMAMKLSWKSNTRPLTSPITQSGLSIKISRRDGA